MKPLVTIIGGGDIATGIAHRLFRSGFHVIITELNQPTVIRRTVAFAAAVFQEQITIEGVSAIKASVNEVPRLLDKNKIPVVINSFKECLDFFRPAAVIDATISKQNIGTRINMASIVIGVGPGFIPGKDVHAVIETMRGHNLGRVLFNEPALANTGIPGEIGGYTVERILRSPADGYFLGLRKIGEQIEYGEPVAKVGDIVIHAKLSGILRGILYSGLHVTAGMKVGDIDPRAVKENCFSISDKARAVGGGVLEAILYLTNNKQVM